MLLALLLAGIPVEFSDRSVEFADVRLHVGTLAGLSVFEVDAELINGGSRFGLVTGARVGLHATRPPLTNGGGRWGFMPTLSVRHDFKVERTDWSGGLLFNVTVWRLIIGSGLGYGLSVQPQLTPRHTLEILMSLGMQFGPLVVTVGMEARWRLGNGDGRTINVVAGVGFEWELLREEG